MRRFVERNSPEEASRLVRKMAEGGYKGLQKGFDVLNQNQKGLWDNLMMQAEVFEDWSQTSAGRLSQGWLTPHVAVASNSSVCGSLRSSMQRAKLLPSSAGLTSARLRASCRLNRKERRLVASRSLSP